MAADELIVESINESISLFMGEQKINQTQMAALLDMSTNTLRWKREGKYDWSLSEILRLSDIVGKTLDELVDFKRLTTA